MDQDQKVKTWHSHLLPYLIFFIGSGIFFGLFGDYIEFHQEKLSLFVFSRDYLIDNLIQPGALLVYLGNFLTTFYYYPLAGALIISAIICLTIYVISKIIGCLSGKGSNLVPILFGAVVFFLQTKYQYLVYNSLGLLLQLTLFYLTIKYLKRWIPVILFPFWYYFTGGFAWIFGLMYTFYLLKNRSGKEWIIIPALWVVILLIIYLLKEYFLFQTSSTLFLFPWSNENTGSQFNIFIPVVCLVILLPLIAGINLKFFSKMNIKYWLRGLTLAVISLILISVIAIFRYDRNYRDYFNAEKLFYGERFSELIDYNRKHPTTNRLTIFLNNIALCETGKLNDQLFYYPQSSDGQSLFLKWEMYGEVLRRGGYFYYTTGMINEAHRWAYENMIIKGLTPEGLKMLIKTELINGNYRTASKYISVLKKAPFYRSEAKAYESLLFNDNAVESHPELGAKRKEKIEHDFFSITEDPYINIERALAFDSLNRKAFEYKLAYLMLIKDYKGIASGLTKLESFGFNKIPVHLEEAAMVYRISNLGPMPDLGNLKINPQTEARFRQFLQTFQTYGNNLKSAQPFLKQKFGNTFWYYAFYH